MKNMRNSNIGNGIEGMAKPSGSVQAKEVQRGE